jgi:hypothetical protein
MDVQQIMEMLIEMKADKKANREELKVHSQCMNYRYKECSKKDDRLPRSDGGKYRED